MDFSGQRNVPAAGTARILAPESAGITPNCAVIVKAHETNTGVIAIGNDGANDVTLSNGLRLLAGQEVIFKFVGNLSSLWIDSSVNGEGVSWACLNF